MHEPPPTDPTDAFLEHRARLLGIAMRILGSAADAEDAVQETWLRLRRTDPSTIENLAAWATTVVSRICLNVLRSRGTRREEALDARLDDPVLGPPEDPDAPDPEAEATTADAVGVALLLVLDTLTPAERLAFVLHDLFAVPFDEIAPVLDKSVDATRQLASRARRRVQGREPVSARPDDAARRRAVVDAFFAAARRGDLDTLIGVLAPDVVLRSDGGPVLPPTATAVVRGAEAVASRAVMFSRPEADLRPATIDGRTGVVVTVGDTIVASMAFDVVDDRIVSIDSLADPERLATLDLREIERR